MDIHKSTIDPKVAGSNPPPQTLQAIPPRWAVNLLNACLKCTTGDRLMPDTVMHGGKSGLCIPSLQWFVKVAHEIHCIITVIHRVLQSSALVLVC